MNFSRSVLALAAALPIAASGAHADSASAATTVMDNYNGKLTVEAAPGKNNSITIEPGTNNGMPGLWMKDVVDGVIDGMADGVCDQAGTAVFCHSKLPPLVTIDVGDGANNAALVTLPAEYFNKAGDASVVITGGPGLDWLNATGTGVPVTIDLKGGTAQHAYGGSKDDVLIGSTGKDFFAGGAGKDQVTYAGRQTPLKVTQDGVANDGASGEGDNVSADIEHVLLGVKDDVFVGSDVPNLVQAGSGADHIDGGGGDDLIFGDDHNDTVVGGGGFDELRGGHGADTLAGGERDDELFGGTENDVLHGDVGDDALTGEAGNDKLFGDAGDDALIPDPGADLLDGGIGTMDSAGYGRTAPQWLSVNGVADDGVAGEGDNIVAIESLSGGSSNDQIVGDAGTNFLYGFDGADKIDGGPGIDFLRGGLHNDTLIGRDALLWRDDVGCNDAADVAVLDVNDVVASDCETVDRAPAPPGVDPKKLGPGGIAPGTGPDPSGHGGASGTPTGPTGSGPGSNPGAALGRPSSKIRKLARAMKARTGKRRVRGTGRSDVGLRRINVSVVRRAGKACYALSAKGSWKRYKTTTRACRPKFLLRAKGTTAWSIRLPQTLPKGTYTIASRAIDKSGRREAAPTAKRGNLRRFKVT